VSMSPTTNEADVEPLFMSIERLGGREIVGGEFTVNWNVVALIPPVPSSTVNVIAVVPNWFGAGVIVIVGLAPLPPSTMLALGTSVGFDEIPVTESDAAGVSRSPTVKPSAPVAPFS